MKWRKVATVTARAAGAAKAACEVTRRGLVPCREVFARHIPGLDT